jgi:EAL domain-containing protein (putative c-di-GMP-specific phosphodiesterase class I)/CheY-like chemotaxis protein
VITVLIADDEPVIRNVLVDVVNEAPDCAVAAIAADAVEAIARAAEMQPDVAIIDVRMPGGGGEVAAAGIRESSPHTHVLAFSAHGDRETVLRILHAGASGYIVKGASPSEIIAAIRRASFGETTLDTDIAGDFVNLLNEQTNQRVMATVTQDRRVAALSQVINNHRLEIALQPIVRLSGRALVGFEALARIDVPPIQGPDFWFAEAERAGMRVELEMCAVACALQRLISLPSDTYLAINASPITVLTGKLAQVIPSEELYRIVLEITEHTPVSDYSALNAALLPLRKRGMRVAIDDAGAGFASLRHVIQLHPEIIKLDRSLVDGIDTHPSQMAVVKGLISSASQMGAAIVAEGIETVQELEVLDAMGAEFGQGYLLGRPSVQLDAPLQLRRASG